METEALIFDLDGTVLDNEKQWGQAFKSVLAELGVEVNKRYPHTSGIGVKENWPLLIKKYDIETDLNLEDLEKSTRDEYEKLRNEVEIQPGFEDFITTARKMGYITALATSNIWLEVEKAFDQYQISDFFDIVTTGEEVEVKKPNPSIFLISAQKIGVDPKECVVFEDSPSGIEAALSAGMYAVAVVRDEKIITDLKQSGDVLVINDFTEISISELAKDNS